jgi:signal transduction histidine kinase
LEFWPYQFSLIEEAARQAVFLLVAVGLWLIVSRLSEDLRGKEAKLKVFGDDLTEVRNQLTMVEGHRSRLLANLAKELKPPVEALEADLKKAQKALLKKKTRVLTKLLRHFQVELSGLKDVSGDLDWLATPEWPQRAYRREWVDWALLSRRTITHLSPAAADKGLALKGVSPQKLVLPGDRLALQQVLSQLVGNAIKYTPAGSGKILVELKRESPYALLTVTDRGIGIPEEDKKNLFGEFFRGKRAETSGEPGSGLGLFIVKKILDWHQGIIKVESTRGKGTTVKVWLPMREHEKAGKKLG